IDGIVEIHARGYVHAPLAETRAALEDPEVGVDRREVSEWGVELGVEPEYEVSYVVHTIVHDIVTVEYALTWRHGSAGEAAAAVRWQKTEGSSLIQRLEGSIVLLEA